MAKKDTGKVPSPGPGLTPSGAWSESSAAAAPPATPTADGGSGWPAARRRRKTRYQRLEAVLEPTPSKASTPPSLRSPRSSVAHLQASPTRSPTSRAGSIPSSRSAAGPIAANPSAVLPVTRGRRAAVLATTATPPPNTSKLSERITATGMPRSASSTPTSGRGATRCTLVRLRALRRTSPRQAQGR